MIGDLKISSCLYADEPFAAMLCTHLLLIADRSSNSQGQPSPAGQRVGHRIAIEFNRPSTYCPFIKSFLSHGQSFIKIRGDITFK